jgi:hypothetical protein
MPGARTGDGRRFFDGPFDEPLQRNVEGQGEAESIEENTG